MKISRYFAGTAPALLVAALTACGGGGGDFNSGSGSNGVNSEPLQYSGNTNPAVITTATASAMVAAVIGGSDVAGATSSVSGGTHAQGGQGQVDIGRRLIRTVRATVTLDGGSRMSSVPVDQTAPCAGGGTVRVFGDVNESGTGTLTVIYTNCVVGSDSLTGQATMRIVAYDQVNGIALDFTINFARLATRGTINIDISGSVRVVTNLVVNSEIATENIVALDLQTGRMTKSENLVFIDLYDNVLNPSWYSEGVSGRVFHSASGYVDVTTTTALLFSAPTQAFPGSGEIIITGAANARVRATTISSALVVLALDLDNDGAYETQARVNWSDLTGSVGADLADSDSDGMHNSWESVFGLNPNLNEATGDLDNDGFTNIAEYWSGTLPNVPDASLPTVPANARVVTLADVSDMVYDSGTKKIYASVRTNPGSIVPIDPITGALGTAIPVGISPAKLALSDNGQFLYVALHGEPAVQRINMATQAVDLTIGLGSDLVFGAYYPGDIQVLPGTPQSIAVSRWYQGVAPNHAGVAIFDGTTQRANTTPGHTGPTVIEFSATAGTLYGYDNASTDFGFYRMAVTSGGVTVTDVYNSSRPGGPLITAGFGGNMKFGGGFLFTTSGQMIDPVARVQIPNPAGGTGPTFDVPGVLGLPAPDDVLSRVFYLVNHFGWFVRGYDMDTRQLTGSADVIGCCGAPVGDLIRWGARGFAFRTSGGQIIIVESPVLIP